MKRSGRDSTGLHLTQVDPCLVWSFLNMKQCVIGLSLAWMACLASLGCSSHDAGKAEMAYTSLPRERGPVILFLIDTLRADHLGCYGYERNTSPHLDALAQEGILFEQCLAQSTWTKPATASILTGVYPSSHGATYFESVLDTSVNTIAEILKENGYATAAFVANGFIFDKSVGFDRGFDSFEAFQGVKDPETGEKIGHARAEDLVTSALDWVSKRSTDDFLLYVHVVDPHSPYGAPEPFTTRFSETEYTGNITGQFGSNRIEPGVDSLSAADWQHLRDLYDGEIAYTDSQFDRLLSGLKSEGLLEKSNIVVVSDHGEEFYDHQGIGHPPTMFQEVVRVPLMVRLPFLDEIFRGRTSDLLCRQIDVLPTILDAVGIANPPGLQGISLLPRAFGMKPESIPIALSEVDKDGYFRKAVVSGNMKYVRSWTPYGAEYLFDLEKDQGEQTNQIDSGHPDADRLRSVLDAYMNHTDLGFTIVVYNKDEEMVPLRGALRTFTEPLSSATALFTERRNPSSKEGDYPVTQRSGEGKKGENFYLTRFQFEVEALGQDGLSFRTGEETKSVEMYFSVDGEPLPVSQIRFGAKGTRPETNPFTVHLDDIEALVGGSMSQVFPQKDGLIVHIFKSAGSRSGTAELDADTLENLKALGYLR